MENVRLTLASWPQEANNFSIVVFVACTCAKNAQVVDKWLLQKVKQPLMEVRNMTVQELYEYAKQCGVSDYEIRVQFRDDGGEYQGTDAFLYLLAEKEGKVLVL